MNLDTYEMKTPNWFLRVIGYFVFFVVRLWKSVTVNFCYRPVAGSKWHMGKAGKVSRFLYTMFYGFSTKLPSTRGITCTVKLDGFLMMIRPFVISDCVIGSGFWERDVLRHDIFNVAEDDIVIDVGAHIGLYTLYAARKASKGRVIAIEPDRENFVLLEHNVAINGFHNVVLLNAAAAQKEDVERFYVGVDHCESSIRPFADSKISRSYIVRTTTIDRLLEEVKIPKLDWIKVDVEGAEPKVLRGSMNALGRYNAKVLVEVSSEETILVLLQCGYSLRKINPFYILALKSIAHQE